MAYVFVFGSNLAGRHGAGAALTAYQQWGADYGQGEGRQGNSYAIPTKNRALRTLPPNSVKRAISFFIQYAKTHPEDTFLVTRVGTGLAGIPHAEIAPQFKEAPENCWLSKDWEPWVGPRKRWWDGQSVEEIQIGLRKETGDGGGD